MANYPYVNYQQPMYGYGQPAYMNPMQFSQPPVQPQMQNVQPVQQQTPAQANVQAAVQPGFNGRYVTSKEEVISAQIPFDGSTSYFVNTANGEIYSKAYNFANGSAPVETYIKQAAVAQEQAAPAVQFPDYAPLFAAFGEQLEKMSGRIDARIDAIFEKLAQFEVVETTPPPPVPAYDHKPTKSNGKGNK